MARSSSTERVEFYRHDLGEAEVEAVRAVFGSRFLTTGPRCEAFERAFAAHLEVPHVVTVSSCTAGLELALRVLGVKPGDEVVTSPLTFVATANAILSVGATPVFADVDPLTGNLRPEAAEAAIAPRTRAILPVHLYGHLCDMSAFRALADAHGLALLEDAAHCIEGRRDGYGPGQLGDAACFSFYATKSLTCGEGGAVAVHDAAHADTLVRLRLHGIDRDAASRYHDPLYQHYDLVEPGEKANLSDIQAAILLAQLPGIEARRARREAICARYEAAFLAMGIDLPRVRPGTTSARHLFTLLVDRGARDATLRALGEAGIGVAVNYRPVHLMQFYRQRFGLAPGAFPVAEDIGARTVSLPLYPSLADAEVDRVIAAVAAALGR